MTNIVIEKEETTFYESYELTLIEFVKNKEKQVKTENLILKMLFES
jgi:hypothetical protein